MIDTKNEQQPHSFKRKLRKTTYTVNVHFSKDTDKTFKDRVQKLIIRYGTCRIRGYGADAERKGLVAPATKADVI